MKRFRKVYVEITNICNMHCSFCPETNRTKAFMSVTNFEHIAKQIVKYTDYIYLHVKGEPLFHPQLKEILEICNKYNLKVNISTNATLLEKCFNTIKDAKIRQLNISLHSFEKESLEELKQYLAGTTTACNILALNGSIIRYKLWNASDKKETNTNRYILDYLSNIYNVKLEGIPYVKDKKLADNVFLSIKKPFIWPDITSKKEEIMGNCYGLKTQIAILVDGTVVPCCVDNDGQLDLGNVLKNSLDEILNGERALKIKKGFEDNKCVETLCKKCEYRNNV